MKQNALILAVVATLPALPLQAACLAEYKAKQDNPLKLAHDTVEIAGQCTLEDARPQVEALLTEQGWVLLKLVSVSEQ